VIEEHQEKIRIYTIREVKIRRVIGVTYPPPPRTLLGRGNYPHPLESWGHKHPRLVS